MDMQRENKDIIDIYQFPSKRRVTFTKIFPFIVPAVFLFFVTFFIASLFWLSPKNAWIAYKGEILDFEAENFSGVVRAKTNSFNIQEAIGKNALPLMVKYRDKEIRLEKNELTLEVQGPLTTDQPVDLLSFNIDPKIMVSSGGGINPKNLFVIFLNEQKAEDYYFEVDLDKNIILKAEKEGNIIATLKGEEIALQEIELIPIEGHESFELNFTSNGKIAFLPSLLQGHSFEIYGDLKTFKVHTANEANLSLIRSGEPQKLDVPLSEVYGKGIESEYPEIKTSIKSQENGYLNAQFAGEVIDIRIANKTLFPSFQKWFIDNFSTVVTTILTAAITVLFGFMFQAKSKAQ